jgi:hypothetical protein
LPFFKGRASQKNQKENFEYFAHKIKTKFSLFHSLDKANAVNPATVGNFTNNKAVNLNNDGFRLDIAVSTAKFSFWIFPYFREIKKNLKNCRNFLQEYQAFWVKIPVKYVGNF